MANYIKNIGKVVCIGRNYVDHIKELNNMAPAQPFFFLKPTSSIVQPQDSDAKILIPKGTDVHYEVELALIMGKTYKNVSLTSDPKADLAKAIDAIDSYALAIDLTARNVQAEAKKKGLPWSIAKGFDTFLPLSNQTISKDIIKEPHKVFLQLDVNGKTHQADSTELMIFQIPRILSTISSIMTLQPGDIVLTGTPKGVGPIVPGDKVKATLSYDGAVIPEATIELDVAQKDGPYVFAQT